MIQDQSQLLFELAVILLTATALALCCMPIAMQMAHRFGIVDRPNARKTHARIIPYLGGVAIFVAFLVATLVFVHVTREILVILVGATIMMITGALDDKFDLSAKLRLLVHFSCALLVTWGGVSIAGIANPFNGEYIPLGILSWPLSILWIMGISNAINWIDGLDGLSAGSTVIICATLIIIAWQEGNAQGMLMLAALAGASLGFLYYNFYPAKVFMGDAGAMFIGFVLGCLSIQGTMKNATFAAVAAPVIALGLPLFDTAVVMFRRILAGKSPMSADRTHAHHRLFDNGFSQKQTVLWLYAVSICFGLAAIGITSTHGRVVAFVVGLFGILMFIYAHRLESKRVTMRQTRDMTEELEILRATKDFTEELQSSDPKNWPK